MTYQPQHFAPGESPPTKPGGIIMVYGHPGVGKTQFCTKTEDVASTLFFANFDRDASHIIVKYTGQGGVYYDQFTALTEQQALAVLEKIEGLKNAAISNKGILVLDNVAACADIVAMALYDKNKYGALAYGKINTWWKKFLLSLENEGIWCLLTAPSKEMWADLKSTGLYGSDSWKHLDGPIMAELWLFTSRPAGAKNEPKSIPMPKKEGEPDKVGEMELPADYPALEYKGQIMLAKKRPAVQGMIMKNPSLKGILKALKEVE